MSNVSPSAETIFYEGIELMAAGDADAAECCFRGAITLDPSLGEAHTNLGLLLEKKGKIAEAEQHYLEAIMSKRASGRTHLNLGALLAGQKRFEEAEAAYRTAIKLMPNFAPAWSNFGALLACLRRDEHAELLLRRAIELDPNYRVGKFNLSYLLLRQGRFEEGWRCLEARDWYAQIEEQIPCPRWLGEPVFGQSMLIVIEAGHGDMIQFCRYASVFKRKKAAKVIIICHPPLKTLFGTMDGVDEVYAFDEEMAEVEADFWTPPLSIPYYCETRLETIPAQIPYLHPDAVLVEKWAHMVLSESPGNDLRVGLVWKGSVNFENDADRSLPGLTVLASLWAVSGIRFFSLQKGAGEIEAADPPLGLPLVNLGPQIGDFADTAAIVANLDLVISVDTAVAHLVGALGKQCWLLLPEYKTDWRWLTERSDSPWYPGVMRLFRQSRTGDWADVIDVVRRELEALASGRTSASN